MLFTFRATSNTIAPDLAAKIRAAQDARPAMQAAGLVIESFAKRAFREPSLRPAPWAALSAATIREKARRRKSSAVLIRDAVLVRSPRIVGVTSSSVTVGTDRPYARFHQFGKGRRYRPFFPVDRNGNLTALARTRIESALRRALRLPR